jgi:integrase
MKHLPVDLWPQIDRDRFRAAFRRVEDPFDDQGPGAHLAPRTIAHIEHSYRRWLGALLVLEPDALDVSPGERVTVERVRGYVRLLQETMNAISVASLVGKLYAALSYMDPQQDWAWLRRIKRRLEANARPKPRPVIPFTSEALIDLGHRLMDDAEAKAEHDVKRLGKIQTQTACLYRDGLLIAFLGLVPLRRSNVVEIELGSSLTRTGDTWVLFIDGSKTKNGDDIEAVLPGWVALRLERFLERYRPLFRGADRHAGLWPSRKSAPMTAVGICATFQTRILKATGIKISLHDVRRIVATTIAIAAPADVSIASDLLGHRDHRITEAHYNRARGIEAVRAISELIMERRTQKLSRRAGHDEPVLGDGDDSGIDPSRVHQQNLMASRREFVQPFTAERKTSAPLRAEFDKSGSGGRDARRHLCPLFKRSAA